MSDVDGVFARFRALIAGRPDPGGQGDTAGLLKRACGAAVQTLSASGAGVAVMTDDGSRGVGAASDPGSARLEELQLNLGEGPCVDAYVSRRAVLVPDLADGAMVRWPAYAPAVHEEGVRAVFAFPLQIGSARLGVLDVFRDRAGKLTADELWHAMLLADATVATLLDQLDPDGGDAPLDELGEAVENRVELFQAQGMVMVQLGISIGEAIARMRAYAYARDRRLGAVARDIVARRLRFDPDHS